MTYLGETRNRLRVAGVDAGATLALVALVLVCSGALLGCPSSLKVTVPDFTGLTLYEATVEIESRGIEEVDVATGEFSDAVPPGRVVRTEPAAGTEVIAVHSIKLFLSKGPEPTMQQPIAIASVEDLQKIGPDAAYPLNARYRLTANIDASATADWNNGAGFAPIGSGDVNNPTNAFYGKLEGNGRVITGLHINRPNASSVGLFGYLGPGAVVEKVHLVDGSVTGGADTGALAGLADMADVRRCTAAVDVAGTRGAGGLIGSAVLTQVTECAAMGAVSGHSDVGGLVGDAFGGAIVRSCADGPVAGTLIHTVAGGPFYGHVGGLVGANLSEIADCYALGSVIGSRGVGGLTGNTGRWTRLLVEGLTDKALWPAAITVNASEQSFTTTGTVARCYSAGLVQGLEHAGGLIGRSNSDTDSASFWDVDTSGQASSVGGAGKPTANMKKQATYTGAGWDFAGVWGIASGQYPHLLWETP